MAAIARTHSKRVIPRRWILAGLGAALIGSGIVAVGLPARATPATPSTTLVARGGITASVSGIGTVSAAQTLDLTVATAGTVTQMLVQPGDTVTAGQPIARLDDRALRSQVANARAGLDATRAKLVQAQQGDAKPDDLAAARAQLASTQDAYDKLAAGPSGPDVASAEASLKNAEANLKSVLAGPTASDVATAQASVQSAEAQLVQAQQNLTDLKAQPRSADVQNAELALEQAKDALWSAQVSRDATCGPTSGQGGNCQSANANVAAQETAVNAASAKLAQTNEPPTVQQLASDEEAVRSAQAAVNSAKAKLAQVTAGPAAADRQSAQSQADEARASLVKAQTSVDPNDLAQARANVAQAQANLDKLTAPATDTDLEIQQASVVKAEQTLQQAQLNLDAATLRAPFSGIIASVSVVPGSAVGGGTAVARLVDRSTLHVDLKLGENDVVTVAVGQPAVLTSDSLPGWSAKGKVSYIAPASETTNGVTTYAVRVTFPVADPRLRVGMTANVGITTAHHDNALLVPNTSLLPKGAGRVVEEIGPNGHAVDVDVQTGLTDGAVTEVVSGLRDGDRVVELPSTGAPRPSGGFFGG